MNVTEVMDRYIGAMRAGDRAAAYACYAEDAVGHVPGRSRLAGTLHGRAAIVDYIETVIGVSEHVELDVVEVLCGREHAVILIRERLTMGGEVHEIRRANAYRIAGDEIVEVRIHEGDQYAVDALLAEHLAAVPAA